MLLFVWAFIGLSDVSNDPRVVATTFLMTLYSSTEQGVFISMLLYRFNNRGFPRTVYFSAAFYVITRAGISVGVTGLGGLQRMQLSKQTICTQL